MPDSRMHFILLLVLMLFSEWSFLLT